MGLEPGAEPTHQQPHQPQQLRQFPTLTPERILQFKTSANFCVNVSVNLICENFSPDELVNHNINDGHGHLVLNPVKLQEIKDFFPIFIHATTKKGMVNMCQCH